MALKTKLFSSIFSFSRPANDCRCFTAHCLSWCLYQNRAPFVYQVLYLYNKGRHVGALNACRAYTAEFRRIRSAVESALNVARWRDQVTLIDSALLLLFDDDIASLPGFFCLYYNLWDETPIIGMVAYTSVKLSVLITYLEA